MALSVVLLLLVGTLSVVAILIAVQKDQKVKLFASKETLGLLNLVKISVQCWCVWQLTTSSL